MEERRRDGVEEEQPSSPGMSQVELKDSIEPLLKFTLESAMEGSIDIGMSKEFCSNLLKDDDPNYSYHSSSSTPGLFEGVPPCPLYKYLASVLCESISTGTVCKRSNKMPLIQEDSSLKKKEFEWDKLILGKGSDLLKILSAVDFELQVQEPFFSQFKDGRKTVEGRCAVGDYGRIKSGDLILFNKCLLLQVEDIHRYPSFSDMLGTEDLAKVLPGVETIEEGVQIYRKFYSEEKERSKGVLAICLLKPASQLYDPLAAIFAGLRYDGVQKLLGLAHTVGTVPEALPLPRSMLLSTFSLPHNSDVKSSVLTDGARALAKHVNRSNGRFWGSFVGSESHKNMLALDLIDHLIAHCCWLNVHIVPPHGAVFEIRVRDGYGARWSLDGIKFIGFLEPYMEDGHRKGWKH